MDDVPHRRAGTDLPAGGTISCHDITVNGVARELRCAGSTPLLQALRNDLGLVGTRFGCGSGQCGACNVWVDGRVVHSCDLPVEAVRGEVTTVEGLHELGVLDALTAACIDLQAFQCAYCCSGILVSAAALLDTAPDADEVAIRQALDGNLCRCGAHTRILAAVRAAQRHRRGEPSR